jgi:hypothetical protein
MPQRRQAHLLLVFGQVVQTNRLELVLPVGFRKENHECEESKRN